MSLELQVEQVVDLAFEAAGWETAGRERGETRPRLRRQRHRNLDHSGAAPMRSTSRASGGGSHTPSSSKRPRANAAGATVSSAAAARSTSERLAAIADEVVAERF